MDLILLASLSVSKGILGDCSVVVVVVVVLFDGL